MEPLKPIQAKSVRSFGLVWLLTLACATIVFPVVSVLSINYYNSEDAAWIDLLYRQKHIALERRASESRRLIIVGGSATLYGIDAELIEKKLHIPTVNFGTHAGLGLRYMLDRAQRELRQGDIVLLAPEYETWDDDYRDWEGPAFEYIWTYDKRYLVQMNPIESGKLIAAIPWAQWPRSVQGWFDRLNGDYFHFPALSFCSVGTLDPNGDIHSTSPSSNSFMPTISYPRDPALPSMRSIGEFAAYARSKGIRLLLTWPNMARPTVLSSAPGFLMDVLQKCGFTVLDQPTDNCFPPEWFMDTPYHTNPCCRRIRTEELIRRLRPVLGLPPAPRQVTGLFLLAGTNHHLTGGNVFADDPGIRFRYLSQDADPRAILPATVAQLVRAGKPIFTDSEDARAPLASAGLSLELLSHQTQTIPEWFAQYPASVFCIAAAQNHSPVRDWNNAVPATVYQRLASGAATAAIFGPGAPPILSDEINEERIDRLEPKLNPMPCVVTLQTSPQAQITVDDLETVSSPDEICAVAIDPEMGIVIGSAVFTAGEKIETWRLYRVVRLEPHAHI